MFNILFPLYNHNNSAKSKYHSFGRQHNNSVDHSYTQDDNFVDEYDLVKRTDYERGKYYKES